MDWESILRVAAERVQNVAQRLGNTAEGATKLGVGAGGDRTMVADMEAEKEVLSAVRDVEDLRVVTEEKGEFGPRDSRWTLIVDPIDGSSNFERGIPFYCTSLAVLEGQKLRDVRYALVRNLVTGDVYYSESGHGSKRNAGRISTSKTLDLGEAAIIVDTCRATVANVTRTAPLTSSVKRQSHFGANALELCFLAEGKVDVFVDVRGRMRIVDFAGAYLIAKEAGAVVTTLEGRELDPRITLTERFSLAASANEALHRQVLEKVR